MVLDWVGVGVFVVSMCVCFVGCWGGISDWGGGDEKGGGDSFGWILVFVFVVEIFLVGGSGLEGSFLLWLEMVDWRGGIVYRY